MSRKALWAWFLAIAIVLIAAGFLLPGLANSTNCGGNTAALSACKGYVLLLQTWAADHENKPFDFSSADAEAQRDLLKLPGSGWIRSARLMAKIRDVKIDPAGRKKVIMVCDEAYNNVPRKFIGNAPPSHAVAYSTGETGLISPEEFSRLKLNGFVDLQALGKTLLPKN